jgi:photosystem II stability/assembly factor-like uncharacterized protein
MLLPPSTALPPNTSIFLRDVDFVDPQTGWASGIGAILSTRDGGQTWQPQYTGRETFLQLDFISPLAGWAVGIDRLLGTTDGGSTWMELGEPQQPLVAVDFVSSSLAWGVSKPDLNDTYAGGQLVATTDGGVTWTDVSTPAPVQSVCAASADDVWAAGGVHVFHSTDGGATWSTSFTAPVSGDGWAATIQCAGPGAAWVQFQNGSAALNHQPYVIYRTLDGGGNWDVMMAEQYTLGNIIHAPEGPGPYPGPFSLIDARTAFVTGFCGPCGSGTTYGRGTVDGGTTWSPDTVVLAPESYLTPQAVDFVNAIYGWAVLASSESAEILATADGGRTWAKQYP